MLEVKRGHDVFVERACKVCRAALESTQRTYLPDGHFSSIRRASRIAKSSHFIDGLDLGSLFALLISRDGITTALEKDDDVLDPSVYTSV